ncbi:hypothetical protein [Thermophilibacter provencensis]
MAIAAFGILRKDIEHITEPDENDITPYERSTGHRDEAEFDSKRIA